MRSTVVAVDLETTGFDHQRDKIIEIGAVRFLGDEVLGEWHSMINPGIEIPPFISRLTGIENSEVRNAPTFSDIASDLRDFIGDDPVIGHNLSFDLGFLGANGLHIRNPRLDTYAIASAVLPLAARYNLSALAISLGVSVTDAHRALNDARVTASVCSALWKKAAALPRDLISEIASAGSQANWDGHIFFSDLLRHSSNEAAEANDNVILEEVVGLSWSDTRSEQNPINPKKKIEKIDVSRATSMVQPGGALAEAILSYEYRSQQAEMMELVGDAFNRGQHVMIEAPTGVGKSMAYLIPAAQFAAANNDRVVVSTNTLTLQEQLIQKDIPLLQSVSDVPFSAAVLKGRVNYLCHRKFNALRSRGASSGEESLMLARILVWSRENPSGDKGDLALRGPIEEAIWRRLSADDDGCKTERCSVEMGGQCPFHRAKTAAERANILIVNHALLLSDMAAEGRVLPEYRYLVIDEAHHLEEATTDGLSFRTSMDALNRQISDLGTENSGLLGIMLRSVRGSIPEGYVQTLSEFVGIVVQANSYMQQHVEHFFKSLVQCLRQLTQGQSGDYTQFIRITQSTRTQQTWSAVETAWDNLSQFTSSIAGAMSKLDGGLRDLADYDIDDYDDLVADVGTAARRLGEIHAHLKAFVNSPDPNTIYWTELQSGSERLSLHAAPLDVGPLIKRFIWDTKDTVVLTSATLRTGGSFRYVRDRLDADHVQEFVVDSPFDYESSTLLFVVDDIDEPSQGVSYQAALQRGVLNLCLATEGRALVLFTSHAQLRETAAFLEEPLAAQGIVLYDQASGSSRSQLLQGFIQSEKAVLLGTRSFWEGVDLPGSDLSVLAIARLPFSVPTDPLFAARSEQFEDPFMQYSVPETILRFRQGFGRLIRRKSDRGVVAIFDKRVISKRYGQLFLDSLPKCTVRRGSAAELAKAAERWLDSV